MKRYILFWLCILLLFIAGCSHQGTSTGDSASSQKTLTIGSKRFTESYILGEILRSATTFHDLVTNLRLNGTLGPDQHVQGPDGQFHHPL